jgi:immunity protein, SdpI family
VVQIVDTVRRHLGWCPMTAAVQSRTQEQNTASKPVSDGDPGPVERRAVLYVRLAWIVIGLSWLITLAFLPFLPETIPVHWNIFGEADGFARGLFGAFSLPVILTVTAIILMKLPRFDQMRRSIDRVRDIYSIMIFSIVSFLLALQVMVLLTSVGMDLPVAIILPMMLGFLFIVIGSLLPHIGRNTTMGIRLPWTIRDEKVWKMTHEHGGPLFVIAGVLIVLGGPVAGIWAMPLMEIILLGTILYITIWSYRLSKTGTPGM